MSQEFNRTSVHSAALGSSVAHALSTHKVLKNTYALLGMTLLFSAFTAYIAMAIGISSMTALLLSIAAIAILWFALPRTIDSSMGLVWTFVFTGLLGASLGPMLTYYLAIPSGAAMVAQALGGTAFIFFALSAYALFTKKDFSFLGGMLMVGLLVALVAMIANLFLQMPILQLTISSAVILIMSGFILFDTSRIIHGGETNYVRATVSMYLNLYNIFVHLLSILGIMGSDD